MHVRYQALSLETGVANKAVIQTANFDLQILPFVQLASFHSL